MSFVSIIDAADDDIIAEGFVMHVWLVDMNINPLQSWQVRCCFPIFAVWTCETLLDSQVSRWFAGGWIPVFASPEPGTMGSLTEVPEDDRR